MAAIRLDGKVVSAAVAERLKETVAELSFAPKLVFVRVGEDPASAYYVRSKERMAKRVGVVSETHVLPVGTSQAALEELIDDLNADPEVDGILVQLPLPDGSGVAAGARPDRSGQGRRRPPPGQRGSAVDRPRRAGAGHAARAAGAARPLRRRDRGATRGDRGALEPGRPAGGRPVPAPQRHGDDGALAHARPRRRRPAGGHRGRRGRACADDHAGRWSSPGPPCSTSA